MTDSLSAESLNRCSGRGARMVASGLLTFSARLPGQGISALQASWPEIRASLFSASHNQDRAPFMNGGAGWTKGAHGLSATLTGKVACETWGVRRNEKCCWPAFGEMPCPLDVC